MANENAGMQLRLKLAQRGITAGAEVETTIQKILANTPGAVLAQMEGMSDEEKALQQCDLYFASLGQGSMGSEQGEADPSQKSGGTMPTGAGMTAEDAGAIQDWLDANAEVTGARAARTVVLNQITDKPTLANLHVQGALLIPSVGENFEQQCAQWKANLVDTPENKAAFEELTAAFRKKEPMAVYINEKAREKVIGWTVSTTDEKNNPIEIKMNKEDAIAFLLTSVQGVVRPKNEHSIGIRIRWTEKKASRAKDNESGNAGKGTTSVVVMNRKAVTENPGLSVCSCITLEQNGTKVVNDSYNAKTAKYFEVKTTRMNAKTHEYITRKVRLSGKTQAYRVVRKDDFVEAFGPAERVKDGTALTKKQKQQVSEAVKASFNSFMHDTSIENNQLRTAMAQIRRAKKDVKGFN